MKTILALIDFSDITPKILDHAHDFARAFGGDIVLMHVVPPEPLVVDFEPPAVSPDVFKERQQDLQALCDYLAQRRVSVTTAQFGGLVLETVLAQIGLLQPDVIIMGSHGHGALYHLLMGSITEGVIKHAPLPVLVVPRVPAQEKPAPQ